MDLRTKLSEFLENELAEEDVRVKAGECDNRTLKAIDRTWHEVQDLPCSALDEEWLQGLYETFCDTTNTRERGCDSDWADSVVSELATILGIANWTGEAAE